MTLGKRQLHQPADCEGDGAAGCDGLGVARGLGGVTGPKFGWQVEIGVARKKRAWLDSVALPDDATATTVMRPPEATIAVDVPDGRHVFAPIGGDLDAVRTRVESGEIAPC